MTDTTLDPLHIANECRKQMQELVDVFEPTPRSFMRMTQGQLSAIKRTKTLIAQLEALRDLFEPGFAAKKPVCK